MRKARFTEEQMVVVIREADRNRLPRPQLVASGGEPGRSELPVPGQQRSRNPLGRATFAMIFSQLCRRARQGRGKGLPALSARRLIVAAMTALSLITGAFLLALAAGDARAPGSAPPCDAAGGDPLPAPPRWPP